MTSFTKRLLIGPDGAVDGNYIVFDGISGRRAKDSGVPSGGASITWKVRGFVEQPQALYASRPQIVMFRAEAALHIVRVHIQGNDSTPTSELAGDLKKADDVFTGSFANAAVIVACDTTNGAFTDTTSYAVASGKYIYFQMDASPHADWKDFYIEVYYTLD